MIVNGVDFFSAGLRDVPVNNHPVGEGVCIAHGGPALLYRTGNAALCRGCMLLRQSYPIRLKARGTREAALGKLRLSLGNYMLITETTTRFWGEHQLPKSIVTKPALGAFRQIVRDLILDPPAPPWMFISFARSNASGSLHVTTSNDLLLFSGKFFLPGALNEPPIERLNRRRVMALHQAADLTRNEWEKLVLAQAALHDSNKALPYLQEVYANNPALARLQLPLAKTPEYFALRLIARET